MHLSSRFLKLLLLPFAISSGGPDSIAKEKTPTYRDFVLNVTERTDDRVSQRLRITKHRLGTVNFPSGRLVVADPLTLFVYGDDPVQDVNFLKGEYPVEYFMFAGRDNPTVAMAQLVLTNFPVVRWRKLKNHTGVDAGVSSFMSIEAFEYLSFVLSKKGMRKFEISNYYDDVLANEMVGEAEDHLIHTPIGQKSLKISIVRSGFGDGHYPNYVGLDASGQAARIVTTFGVLETALMPEGVDDPDEERLTVRQFEGVRRP